MILRPRVGPLDSVLAELTAEFAAADERTRRAIRGAIRMEEFYTLLAFSRRASVFALRERSIGWVIRGLTALAMIEARRVDWRDIMEPLALLNHASDRLDGDWDGLLTDAQKLAERNVAGLIGNFASLIPEEKNLRSSWGYDEVEIDGYVGFVRWEFEPYHPTHDLLKIALAIADFIAKDKYQPDDVQVATDLPAFWLKMSDDTTLEKALKSVRACASVHGKLRPEEDPSFDEQMFCVWIVEMKAKSAADTLLRLSRKKKPTHHAMLGVADERLFCFVVARSFVGGVESFETTDTLTRFAPGLARILRRLTSQARSRFSTRGSNTSVRRSSRPWRGNQSF